MKGKARIGTSGFTYPHWRDVFYPQGVPQKRWLEHYAEHFDTVEINSTFYHMPAENVCRSWRERTPKNFLFVVKMNRMITHRKRLTGCGDLVKSFFQAVEHLGEKLGPVLIQLPPRWSVDPLVLEEFFQVCPGGKRLAMEFRDESWLCEKVFGVLRRRCVQLVAHDMIPNHPREATADFVYLRFHGPGGHAGCYTEEFLRAEAGRIRDDLAAGRDVFVYFNNDVGGNAVRNALTLRKLVGRTSPAG